MGRFWSLFSRSLVNRRAERQTMLKSRWFSVRSTLLDLSIRKNESKKSKHISRKVQVRRPGLEPGFRRWQRLVITTTLSAQMCSKVWAFKQFKYIELLGRRQIFFFSFFPCLLLPFICPGDGCLSFQGNPYSRQDSNLHLGGMQEKYTTIPTS